MKSKMSVRVLAEIAIFAALGFALDVLQGGIFKGVFVNGGSIGLAMVPVFIISYRRGLVPGILCGLVLSVVQMLGGIYIINASNYSGAMQVLAPFFQVLLDYLLAYTVVGVAGVFAGLYAKESTTKGKLLWIIVGTVIGGFLKYICHVLSGGFFWLGDGSYKFMGVANSSWLYSFVYNGAYCIPNIIICTALMVLIAKVYPQFLNENAEAQDSEVEVNEE